MADESANDLASYAQQDRHEGYFYLRWRNPL